jgi:hypothetical protein
MTCSEVRPLLPLWIYGDLEPASYAAVDQHLAGCVMCQREVEALRQVRRLLTAVPAPQVDVSLPHLYQAAAEQQQQRVRTWRRIALVCGLAAAVLVVLIAGRLQMRLSAGELVLHWGTPAPPPVEPPALQVPPPAAPLDRQLPEQVHILRELIHALKQDVDERNQHLKEQVTYLQQYCYILQLQLEQLRRSAGQPSSQVVQNSDYPAHIEEGGNP